MYGLALSLWMIDIHNVVTEIQTTLLSPVAASTGSLANAYSIAMSKILRLSSVEDVLYAYMVGCLCILPSPHGLTHNVDQYWRRNHHLACLRVLVKRQRAIHFAYPSCLPRRLHMCVFTADQGVMIH